MNRRIGWVDLSEVGYAATIFKVDIWFVRASTSLRIRTLSIYCRQEDIS